MSYNISNIKNVLSQIFKLDVSKIELKATFNNFALSDSDSDSGSDSGSDYEKEDYYFIFNYNNNQIQIYYRLEQEHKNITFFSIRINYDNVLTYNSNTITSEACLIKTNNIIIFKRTKNNKIIYLKKKYENKFIIIYNNINKFNYLLLFSKEIIFSSKAYYIKNIIKSYYINYLIFKKIFRKIHNYYDLRITFSNNILLYKILY